MQFDMRALPLGARYKLLNSTVTPRPIAWVTTVNGAGLVNAAPYSFFNVCGIEPPLVVLGLLKDFRTRALKDTARNIIETGEFVVNLVSEADAPAMNLSSVDAPAEVSEVDYAGIQTTPSSEVRPPRIATAPVSFECRKVTALDIGTHQTVLIGEVLVTHIQDQFVSDPDKFYLDTPAMGLVGRTHGAGWYARGTDQFALERPKFDPERAEATRK
ncbi:flavin reductase family protein [Novosphingobium sp.]|uniref:flavin reductase family protein n=1 Tax=Novosphingobium sp. TaxID=1874826 RepID=UPI0035AF6CC5